MATSIITSLILLALGITLKAAEYRHQLKLSQGESSTLLQENAKLQKKIAELQSEHENVKTATVPEFEFDHVLGIQMEKSTGTPHCTSCLTNNKKSPLKEYEDRWICLNKECRKVYYKIGKEPQPRGQSGFKCLSRGLKAFSSIDEDLLKKIGG